VFTISSDVNPESEGSEGVTSPFESADENRQ
jgi:hypothetical protein